MVVNDDGDDDDGSGSGSVENMLYKNFVEIF